MPRSAVPADSCLCDHCVGKCCRYFCLEIDTPTTWDDYDTIRWYLTHGLTLIYVESGKWHLVVFTQCQYLGADNRCGIYLNRPKICRDYSSNDCEYDTDWQFDKVFETPEQIWEYAEAILPARRRAGRVAVMPGDSAPSGLVVLSGPATAD